MVFKVRYKNGVSHTLVDVFAGPDKDHLANCGRLTMKKEEWNSFSLMVIPFGGHEIIFDERKD